MIVEILSLEGPMRTAMLVFASLLLITVGAHAEPPVAVQVVKYDGLSTLIKQQRGKVVVVDFWADFCIPCKREFPHLVALHNQYKNDGLVAVSVALDNPSDAKAQAAVLKFLEKQNAGGLTNLHLDEAAELWQQKLGV